MQTDKIQDMTPEKRIKEEIRKVCARMEADLRGYRVVLFGSRTAGTAHDRSDFDVGVLGDTSLPLAKTVQSFAEFTSFLVTCHSFTFF